MLIDCCACLQGEIEFVRVEAATLLRERGEKVTEREQERAAEEVAKEEARRARSRNALVEERDKLNTQHAQYVRTLEETHREERERERNAEKSERDSLTLTAHWNTCNVITISQELDALKIARAALSQERDAQNALGILQKERIERSEREINTLKHCVLSLEADVSTGKLEGEREEERKKEREKERAAKGVSGEERRECVVCLEPAERWMMLRPCGHVCVCAGCCKTQVQCPICRSSVTDSFAAFL